MTHGLRGARKARGWSQDRLIHEIEQYARRTLADVASTASLRVYVSEWENGRRAISVHYSAILRAVLGVTNEELSPGPQSPFGAYVDGYAELIARVDSARGVSLGMVETFEQQTEIFRTMDRQLGAAAMVDQMAEHISTLDNTLMFAVLPDARKPVARAMAGAATLAAWQALDAGAIDRAWRNYETAKRAALEADEPLFIAHAKGEQAFVLADAGRPELGLALVLDAQRSAGGQLSPRLRAWLYAAEAELAARSKQTDQSRRALDAAQRELPDDGTTRDPELPSVFLNRDHLSRWRGNILTALGDDEAMDVAYDALDKRDPTFVRASSGLHCDLAEAHLARGEYEDAKRHLGEARLLANRTGSVRFRQRVERIVQGLV